jgi:hypothetical protein
MSSYYRHQVPPATDGYRGFDQFRNADGTPRYPQRSRILGPLVTGGTSGNSAYSGRFEGKAIVVDNLADVDALPYHADWYAQRAKAALGAKAFDAQFRVYYNESADHLEGEGEGARAARLINYWGVVEQALRDVTAWAEAGVPAPRSSRYDVRDAQVSVPSVALGRGGVQPSISTVTAKDTVRVRVGKEVAITALAHTPIGTGKIVQAEWDFTGAGVYEDVPVRSPQPAISTRGRHVYTEPGTYIVSVKVTAERSGDASAQFARVENIERVRVIVSP